jgi:hypothetical protein
MANTIFISDEYGWTASSGLFEWVLEYLLKCIDDAATKETIQQVVQHRLGSLDVTQMSEAGRREVLSALRTGMVAARRGQPRTDRAPARPTDDDRAYQGAQAHGRRRGESGRHLVVASDLAGRGRPGGGTGIAAPDAVPVRQLRRDRGRFLSVG